MRASKFVPAALSILLAFSSTASAWDRISDTAKSDLRHAHSLARKKDFDGAYRLLFPYLGSYGRVTKKALEEVKKRKFRAALDSTIARAIAEQTTKEDFYHNVDVLSALEDEGVLSHDQIVSLYTALDNRIETLWSKRQITFHLSENFKAFPFLAGPDGQERVFNAELVDFSHQTTITDPQLKEVATFLKTAPNAAPLRQKLYQSLVGKRLSHKGIDLYVQPLLPSLAEDMLKGRTVYFSINTKPRDLFFEDDLATALKTEAATFKPSDAPSPETAQNPLLALTASNVVIDIKRGPERTTTIRYGFLQVDLARALTEMPPDGTYLFDYTQGRIDMRYAAQIGGTYAGHPIKPFIVRGKSKVDYKACSNIRVQNILGGTFHAGFYANQSMADMCAGTKSVPDEDAFRSQIFKQIAQRIAQLPPIQAVIAHDPQTFGAHTR